ncbi:hypothetical protein KJ780_04505, partial [Candidatus Micrarchaeota archaeon]|nr:hypothetical protein [Candidatus Micrarchaeota archaeon]
FANIDVQPKQPIGQCCIFGFCNILGYNQFLSICWYWWLLLLIVPLIIYIIYRYRRRYSRKRKS